MELTEFKLSVKKKSKRKFQQFSISNSTDAANAIRDLFDADLIEYQEEALILMLNPQNKPIGFSKIASGGTAGVIIDPKIVFTALLNAGANAFIIAHNHPSGNLKPSQQDIKTYSKLRQGGDLLDIRMLDGLIITPDSYTSFADDRLFEQ